MATSSIVQLVPTCLVNGLDPEVGLAAARVLARVGFVVEVPRGLTCCGQPAHNAGFADEARAVARHTLTVLGRTTGPIVVPSGSCADMIVHQYPRLFEAEPAVRDRAHAVAERTREFSQFLMEQPQADAIAGVLHARVAYHRSCHLLRGLGVTKTASLLSSTRGTTVVAFQDEEECCGFGGLFSIKNADISGRMLERKLSAVAASGADRLVSCDLGCILHLEGGARRRALPVRVQHLACFLDEALG
ncbi:MAG TPA: (Fe-S)-binding protein [Vicinamibacterales bacterium]|nr:(Fe-S)-binding protein [Vicinamibacterales bacterium]